MQIDDILENVNEEALLLEPREQYDKCIVGITYYGDKFVYDANLVIQSLITDQEMTEEEARVLRRSLYPRRRARRVTEKVRERQRD